MDEAEASLSVLLPTSPLPLTLHWRMQVSFPPMDRRCESLWVKHTLVTWLPWPSYLWLGAWKRGRSSARGRCGTERMRKTIPKRTRRDTNPPMYPHVKSSRERELEVGYLGFGTRVLEEVDLAEVVSHRHHRLAVGATQGVDVGAV